MRAGINVIGFPANISSTPGEVVESEKPIMGTEEQLISNSGGPGRWPLLMETRLTATERMRRGHCRAHRSYSAAGMWTPLRLVWYREGDLHPAVERKHPWARYC
jgi:N-methylhydantoinase B/oxoprolinase/acetone carboxylase alpha subunit